MFSFHPVEKPAAEVALFFFLLLGHCLDFSREFCSGVLVFQTTGCCWVLQKCVSLCYNASLPQGCVSFWSHMLMVMSLRRGRRVDVVCLDFEAAPTQRSDFMLKCCMSSTSSSALSLLWNTGIIYTFLDVVPLSLSLCYDYTPFWTWFKHGSSWWKPYKGR